jgi:L-ascorbate metabolism protein UlaG (beta-lactamase superfamily)
VAHILILGDEVMTNTHSQVKREVQTIFRVGSRATRASILILVGAAIAILAPSAAIAQSTKPENKSAAINAYEKTVKITPIGQRTGEFCALDRALLFEDPTGIRILYDPGITVAGGYDYRLGEVHAILVSHNHFDHIGYRKLTQNPDDPQSSCGGDLDSIQTSNTNTAEIAAVKNSLVLVGSSMEIFLARKIQNIRGASPDGCPTSGVGRFGDNEFVVPLSSPATCGVQFGGLSILTRAAGAPGVRINVVAALHNDSLYNPLLLLPADRLGMTLDDNGLQGYDGLANGFVLTFTNGLRVYLTGDTGPTSDMAFVVRGIYHPNLTVANMDSLNNMGPEEAAYAMRELVHTAAVIPSHAEQPVTVDGKLIPNTRTAEFIRLLGNIPAYLPLSGRTMEFDGDAECISGCVHN